MKEQTTKRKYTDIQIKRKRESATYKQKGVCDIQIKRKSERVIAKRKED